MSKVKNAPVRCATDYLNEDEILVFIKVMRESGMTYVKIGEWLQMSPASLSYRVKKDNQMQSKNPFTNFAWTEMPVEQRHNILKGLN